MEPLTGDIDQDVAMYIRTKDTYVFVVLGKRYGKSIIKAKLEALQRQQQETPTP